MVPPKPEDEAIDAIAELLRSRLGPAPAGDLWIGDDAAVLGAARSLLTVDATVAGVHVDLGLCTLGDLGWKALTAAVSDIAAMGGRPGAAVVAACVPPGTDLLEIFGGVAEAAECWGCPVVGGDLSAADQVVVTVAVTGSTPGPPVTRHGARPGDRLYVTGPLGASAAGLRQLRQGSDRPGASAPVRAHRRPRARLEEGWAAREAGATAMMDVSDGLSIDLHRLAAASKVGCRLDDVPVADGATEEEALGGGEDYELVVAVPVDGPRGPDALVRAFARAGLRAPVPIGQCTDEAATITLAGAPLPRLGWEHDLG